MKSRRLHQSRAIHDVLSGFKRASRGQLVMACGTGKTLTTRWIAEDIGADLILVLVPTIGLLDQFASEWRDNCSPQHRYATLCVCSDSTVGSPSVDDDPVDVSTADLMEHRFEVSADTQRIAEFMSTAGRKVVFCTYQSSHLIAAVQVDAVVPDFDLAIADEAHRCAGNMGSAFATIVDGDRIRASRRLFATATPRIYRRASRRKDSVREAFDMNDEARFGSRFHTLSFGAAIQQGLLSDYRVAVILIDDADVQSMLQQFGQSGFGRSANEMWRCAAQVGLLKAMREFDLRRVISFHQHVRGAKEFADELPAVARAMWADVPISEIPATDHVSGAMNANARKQKLLSFRDASDDRRVLTNARCLTEGVDVPGIDGVAFIDPRGSEIDIIQALGRAIRLHKHKEYGTIVLPVFLGTGESASDVIAKTDFKPVWEVLNALRAHDGDFEMALKGRRQALGAVSRSEALPFAKIEWVTTGRVIGLAEALQPILVDRLTDGWEEGFGAAKAHWELHGHCNVSGDTRWPDDGPSAYPLGRWLHTQRYMRSTGKLSNERTERLSALGVVWNQLDAAWEEAYACLSAWHRVHGHSNVRRSARWPEDDPDGFQLGVWVRVQRVAQKSGRLSDSRQTRLKSLGFVWDSRASAWGEAFAHAISWRTRYGTFTPLRRRRGLKTIRTGFVWALG
ncbi:DEAD/DEAH box helicase [Cupriavidus sp. D39]|uniref:DEAD/DEAH box helicase n=1 Tax=Cupriavidus sp. D39 TaxID=2997877 RepID=UPI002271B3B9|nr:DEAD/DEAH box helicase [Cupriavidus sp. D39]MCY0853426.1 Helicase associated domain protein [Cupriavidus sp. D39]